MIILRLNPKMPMNNINTKSISRQLMPIQATDFFGLDNMIQIKSKICPKEEVKYMDE